MRSQFIIRTTIIQIVSVLNSVTTVEEQYYISIFYQLDVSLIVVTQDQSNDIELRDLNINLTSTNEIYVHKLKLIDWFDIIFFISDGLIKWRCVFQTVDYKLTPVSLKSHGRHLRNIMETRVKQKHDTVSCKHQLLYDIDHIILYI